MRNFKFLVTIDYTAAGAPQIPGLADMGFTNVAGINMTTEVINYREGGWNTNYHKLPANTDFGPLTLIQGVVRTKPGMWNLAKNMFAVQWGQGNLAAPAPGNPDNGNGTNFRFNTTVRVLDHPITKNPGSGSPGDGFAGARLAFKFYNCWVGSVAFNDLDAAGNSVLISQMTMHHEGFDVFFDQDAIAAV
jgi:phage tail-like protein